MGWGSAIADHRSQEAGGASLEVLVRLASGEVLEEQSAEAAHLASGAEKEHAALQGSLRTLTLQVGLGNRRHMRGKLQPGYVEGCDQAQVLAQGQGATLPFPFIFTIEDCTQNLAGWVKVPLQTLQPQRAAELVEDPGRAAESGTARQSSLPSTDLAQTQLSRWRYGIRGEGASAETRASG